MWLGVSFVVLWSGHKGGGCKGGSVYEDVNGNDIHTMKKRTFNPVACGCSLNESCFCASLAVNRLHDHVAG